MTPWEVVQAHFVFPEKVGANTFEPAPLQIECINSLLQGLYLDMGTGKTFVSTAIALYYLATEQNRTVVIMPPNLIPQWARWLGLIKRVDGSPLTVVAYAGTPKQRQEISLDGDFVLVGVQMFRKEFARFQEHFHDKPLTVVVDEANLIANNESAQHSAVFQFHLGKQIMLLTGTPLNKPLDAYGLTRFTNPGAYRSRRHFLNVHVEEEDFYGTPTKWRELDLLKKNLLVNSRQILYEDMFGDVEKPNYDLFPYALHPDHRKLYRKLVNEQMLPLGEGKIDATDGNKLRHALGQVVNNWAYFAQDPDKTSAIFEMIRDKQLELNGKLIVFANYRMTVKGLVQHFSDLGARAINSEVSEAQKQKNLQAFVEDPLCKMLVIQYISGGKGLDGLQHVCHTALCAEPCQQPRDFHQAVARLKRRGQRKRPHILMPYAEGTLQVQGYRALVENDTLVTQVVRSAVDLRKELLGE